MNYSVIVAEDETLLQKNIIKKIEQLDLGFHVAGAAQTGIQALELIEEHNPYLLITDIRMPVMDGLELIEKARETHPELDCVILSGFSDFSYAQTAIHLKVREYLLKPVDTEKLAEVLKQLRREYILKKNELEKTFSPVMSETASPKDIANLLKEYLNQEFNKEINLNLIADNLNYSSSYLTKIFTQYFDISPTKYLINLRMQKARQMLESSSDYSVRQIGEAVGYPEQGYFSRIFKKYVGVSPQKYKENYSAGSETR